MLSTGQAGWKVLTAHLPQDQVRGAQVVLVAQHLGTVEGIWVTRGGQVFRIKGGGTTWPGSAPKWRQIRRRKEKAEDRSAHGSLPWTTSPTWQRGSMLPMVLG